MNQNELNLDIVNQATPLQLITLAALFGFSAALAYHLAPLITAPAWCLIAVAFAVAVWCDNRRQ